MIQIAESAGNPLFPKIRQLFICIFSTILTYILFYPLLNSVKLELYRISIYTFSGVCRNDFLPEPVFFLSFFRRLFYLTHVLYPETQLYRSNNAKYSACHSRSHLCLLSRSQSRICINNNGLSNSFIVIISIYSYENLS